MFSRLSDLARRRLKAVIAVACSMHAASVELRAQTATANPSEPTPLMGRMRNDVLRLSEFFDTLLPGTIGQHKLIVDFSPKFSDVRSQEYVRYPINVSYGIKENWEVFGGLSPYSPNPINSGRDHRWGLGEIMMGTRHNLPPPSCLIFDRVTVGFDVTGPLGKPPTTIIDHYTHIRPFVAAARELPWGHANLYTDLDYNRAVRTPGKDTVPPDVVHRHVLDLRLGVLYKPNQYGGFAEYAAHFLFEDHGERTAQDYKIGGIWDVPQRRTKAYRLPGKWQIELAYRISHEDGVGLSQGVSLRVRVRTNLRELLSPSKAKP